MTTARFINTHTVLESDGLCVYAADAKAMAGQNNRYYIGVSPDQVMRVLAKINFQDGPVPENGINGVTIESLLAICADRLEGFQSGPFPCVENEKALISIQAALNYLHIRTRSRIDRGVEGKLKA